MPKNYKHEQKTDKDFLEANDLATQALKEAKLQKSVVKVDRIDLNKMQENKIYVGKDASGDTKLKIKIDGIVFTLSTS